MILVWNDKDAFTPFSGLPATSESNCVVNFTPRCRARAFPACIRCIAKQGTARQCNAQTCQRVGTVYNPWLDRNIQTVGPIVQQRVQCWFVYRTDHVLDAQLARQGAVKVVIVQGCANAEIRLHADDRPVVSMQHWVGKQGPG